jgi:hypothetical protein
MRKAFGKDIQVMIGHHLAFQEGGKLETENEIPSADTLMFCHDIMGRVFGNPRAMHVMMALAAVPDGAREQVLLTALDQLEPASGGK